MKNSQWHIYYWVLSYSRYGALEKKMGLQGELD